MTISASIPLIVTAAGGLVHLAVRPGRLSELGRLAFAVGLLALLLHR